MREKLVASEGMILTNGYIYGKIIYLADGQNKRDFFEITYEAYEKLFEE